MPHRLAPRLGLLLLTTSLLVACGGEDREPAADESAFASVVGQPPTVVTDPTITPERSATTHLVGHLPQTNADQVLDKLLTFERWIEIRSSTGKQPFSSGAIESRENGPPRAVVGKVVFDLTISLDVILRAEVTVEGNSRRIRVTNTNLAKAFPIGRVLDPNAFNVDILLKPHEGGVIIDATSTVKLRKVEDRGVKVTGMLEFIFNWLKTPAS